ncbi:MAG: class I SAM-dependent methyltransferase, partial [Halobacteriovoraceae bacterium]|nr:class I SAM-dependent methyltransferase [Halobacteriovoraceae bacterium]
MNLSLLHRLYLKIDSQIPPFNNFYNQYLESEAIKNAPASYKETGELSYNLLSQNDHQELTNFLKCCEEGDLLEFGCGLSPVSQIFKKEGKKGVSVLGLDFSDRAISHNKAQFPEHKFFQFHQHFDPQIDYDYLVLTDALYQGSRKISFKDTLNRLLKRCRKKAIIIQNHQESHYSRLYPEGIPQKDSTESFR